MKKICLTVLCILAGLLTQNLLAQRTISLETEGLRLGDSCALYNYKNGMPVLLQIAAVKEPGKIRITDTSTVAKEGLYILMLPPSITKDPISVLYSKEDKKNIEVRYYEHNSNVIFKDSDQNNAYASYANATKKFYSLQHNLEEDFLNEPDSIQRKKIRNKAITEQEILYSYGNRIAASYKGSVLEKFISCINTPPIPEMAWNGEHLIYNIEEPKYQNAITFIKKHFWEGVDFTDAVLISTPYLSGKTTQYISLFNVKDTKNLTQAIDALLQEASVNKDVYHVIEEALFNIYLIKSSGYFNEDIGVNILKNEQKQSFTPDWRKEIITSRISFIEKNKIGSLAANIDLEDQKGTKQSMLVKKSKYTVLYFFDPDCSHCMQVTPIVKDWLSSGVSEEISLLAIYVDNNEKEWHKYIKENTFPQNWKNLWGNTNYVQIRTQYWIENIPSIYLLDENKKVILKDVNYKQLIDYFSKK